MTQHATARTRIVGAVAAALTLAGLLAGCSAHPGAAAVVDGRVIPTSDVVSVIDELKPALGDISAAQVLGVLIQEPIVVQVADDSGNGVSEADAKSTLDAVFTGNGLTPPASYSAATLQVGLHQAAATKLQSASNSADLGQQFTDRIGKLDVQINPRFGSWSATDGVGAPTTPTWIVAQQ